MNIPKRVLIGIAAPAVVFASVYGFAASLGVSSESMGSGNAVIAACQAGTVTASYGSDYSSTGPAGYRATTVTLNNLDTNPLACGSKSYRVTLTGPTSSNAALAEQTGTLPSSGTTAAITFAGVSASDVTGIHVVLAG